MTKFSSFVRQINGWGFRRVSIGPDRNSYFHEMFHRDKPELINDMRRRKRPCKSKVFDEAKNSPMTRDEVEQRIFPSEHERFVQVPIEQYRGPAMHHLASKVPQREGTYVFPLDRRDPSLAAPVQLRVPRAHQHLYAPVRLVRNALIPPQPQFLYDTVSGQPLVRSEPTLNVLPRGIPVVPNHSQLQEDYLYDRRTGGPVIRRIGGW